MTEEDIFWGAVAVAEHGDWAANVAHACDGDGALRRQVELLLAAHVDTSPLDTPPSKLAATLLRELATVDAGGEGGSLQTAEEKGVSRNAMKLSRKGFGRQVFPKHFP